MVKPTNIERLDIEYVKSGRWKCVDSPTNAHHWMEVNESGIFHCKYCGDARRYPRTFDGALKATYGKDLPYTAHAHRPNTYRFQQPVPLKSRREKKWKT